MNDTFCETAVRQVFGNRAWVDSYRVISDGYRNLTAEVTCNAHPEPIFFKQEKSFALPRMQQHQIAREAVALRLCTVHDIPVPQIIAVGERDEHPWLMEQFLDGQILSTFELGEQNRHAVDAEFEAIFDRLCTIKSDAYGDTFQGGYVGLHPRWQDTLMRITQITFEDCQEAGLFGKEEMMVQEALNLALTMVNDSSQAVLYHCDLFSSNVMGYVDSSSQPHIRAVIDFGMSMYAPLSYVRSMTKRYSDFWLSFADDSTAVGPIYNLLRIEPLLMMCLFRYEGWEGAVQNHIQACRVFLSECGGYGWLFEQRIGCP